MKLKDEIKNYRQCKKIYNKRYISAKLKDKGVMGFTDGQNDKQIKDLFTGNTTFFTVPRYQRKYVWEQKNWKQLYEDIKYSIEDDEWSHFIGTFVFQRKDIDRQNTEYIIIDGQQRIVTLQIIFLALIAALNKLKMEVEEEAEEIERYIGIISDLINRKPPKGYGVERLCIDYDLNYQKMREVVISNQDIDEMISNQEKSKILQCFAYYYKIFNTKSFDEIVGYYEKLIITKYVGFISYTEEYAYNLFETLNARGTQLKQMELMKNYMFHYLLPKDDIDVYKSRWIEIEDLLFKNKLDCDEFLYHLCKCVFKVNKIRVDDLYDQIKQQLKTDSTKIKEFYEIVVKCVPLYISVVNYEDEKEDCGFIFKYFKIKNNKQFRSALLALLYQYSCKRIDERVLKIQLTKLRNFLMIYNIRGLAANRIDNDVQELAYGIFESKCERDIVYSVNDFLLKDRTFFNLQDIPEAIKGLRYSNKKRYSMATSGVFIYLFEILYKSEYVDYEYISEYSKWSIEHIVSDCNQDDYVSYIGNLLPITKVFNESLKDKSYEVKRNLYIESGYSWVKDYANNQINTPEEKDILERTEKIAKSIASLLTFDIEGMRIFNEQTNSVYKFMEYLKNTDHMYDFILDDIENDDYSSIEGKLNGKYKNQELLEKLRQYIKEK